MFKNELGFYFINAHWNKYLDVHRNNVVLHNYSGYTDQLWHLILHQDYYFSIQNIKYNLVLEGQRGKSANWGQVVVNVPNNTDAQKWDIVNFEYPSDNHLFPIVNRKSGFYLCSLRGYNIIHAKQSTPDLWCINEELYLKY